jgi:multiple sugar transport system ATP-binding protein
MELYERPVNRFVAGFLGQPKMNFLPASAVAGRHPTLPAGTREVGIRPNAIGLVAEGGIPASVVLIERLGGSSLLHVRMDGTPSLVTIETSASPTVKTGDTVHLSFTDGAIYAFDSSGRVL